MTAAPATAVPAVLRRSADLIGNNGLNHRAYWPGSTGGREWEPGVPCCAVGGIYIALGHTLNPMENASDMYRYATAVDDYLRDVLGVAYEPVSIWNDSHGRAEVVAMLRNAALWVERNGR